MDLAMKITCPQTEALTPLMGLTRDGMSTTTNPMWPQVRAGYLRIISIQLSFLISRNCEFKLIVFQLEEVQMDMTFSRALKLILRPTTHTQL